MTDRWTRLTHRPTNQQTDKRVHREVSDKSMKNCTCRNSENWFWCRVASSESNFERRSSRSSCCAVARLFSSASVITTPFLHQTRMYRFYACLRNFCRNGLAKLRHLSLQIFFFVKHFLLNSQILLLARYNSCTRESNVNVCMFNL